MSKLLLTDKQKLVRFVESVNDIIAFPRPGTGSRGPSGYQAVEEYNESTYRHMVDLYRKWLRDAINQEDSPS